MGEEVDTSPIECATPNPSKWERDNGILQRKCGIKARIGQRNDKGGKIKLPRKERETGLRAMGPKWEISIYKDKSRRSVTHNFIICLGYKSSQMGILRELTND